MTRPDIRLTDRFDLSKERVLLNGTQALVRLVLIQKERDRAAGLNTGGYVTGYRGSPLGSLDYQLTVAGDALSSNDILFQPGVNEDLAATALWGTQQAELRGEGRFDGVFGLWYGKGPGVDRSGDALRHANLAGTSPHGGVVMAMGDDHTGESSTTLHQSETAAIDAQIPVLSPAGVQEILDFGVYAYELSRFSGLWCALKLVKDTAEATAVVDGRADRKSFVRPDFDMPPGGLNIRLADTPIDQERRLVDRKRFAAEAFARANRIDQRVMGKTGAKIGFVAAGKNWLDLVHALKMLGIDETEADRLGVTTYKIGQVWPLDTESLREWADGLDLIVVIEEKRKLIEAQIKEALFEERSGLRVYGWNKGPRENGKRVELFPARFCLEPVHIAHALGDILIEEGRDGEKVRSALRGIEEIEGAQIGPDIASRLPYFCAGCPHNSSTKLPDGSRAYAGIGCHYLVQWMDRDTVGYTHMGAEGANWIGEAPFSTRSHVFQNIGDGTYNHSGAMAIRAAIYSGVNITYKILYNDAVALTGGQTNDGGLDPYQIVDEVRALGASRVVVVYDDKEDLVESRFPSDVAVENRDRLPEIQAQMAKVKGTSVIVYVQTCAAEKRRRRRRGDIPDPQERIFINKDICEGCGDCGVQSNCVAIQPVETAFGRKREIDQSTCNKDFSCLNGFCPAFVSIKGAVPKKRAPKELALGALPEPDLPAINGTWNMVLTGVGGTGVVTIGAGLAMAAHVEGKAAAMMEMAGLAQKGGAVQIHVRLAEKPDDISTVRVANGEAHAVVGGDLVVTAGGGTLALVRPGSTAAVVNAHETVTGAFTRDPDFRLPGKDLRDALQARLHEKLRFMDASKLADHLLGDSIFANQILVGAAWQLGLIPLARDSLFRAIELNAVSIEENKRAFELGRWAALRGEEAAQLISAGQEGEEASLDETIAARAAHLRDYRDETLAGKYLERLNTIDDPELKEAVAIGYHKALAYKDEYEVARLLQKTEAQARAVFDGELTFDFHLAPPIFDRNQPCERPEKRRFSHRSVKWMRHLAKLKGLRGTRFDPFARQADRRLERELILTYEADLELIAQTAAAQRQIAMELALLPTKVRGFGPVKRANYERAMRRRSELLTQLSSKTKPAVAAQ